MKNFEVLVSEHHAITYFVNAENEEEAKRLVYSEGGESTSKILDREIVGVKESEEV